MSGGSGTGGAAGEAGSAGVGGAAGSTAGSAGVAGSGGACGVPEDCTNGVDDDCDGKADCQDGDCTKAGYVSIPTGPAGSDYEYYHERNAPDAQAACTSSLTVMKFDLDVPASTCKCECGAAQGASCVGSGMPTVYAGTNCTGAADPTPAAWNVCRASTSTTWVVKSVKTGAFAVGAPGACAPGVKETIPQASFTKEVDLCKVGAVGVGSKAGESCVLPGAAPYASAPCVLLPGLVNCSTIPGYTHSNPYYTDFSDTRACVSACTCDPAAGTKCSASVTFYSGAQCTNSLQTLPIPDGNCHNLPGNGYDNGLGSYEGTITAAPGDCAPKGSATLAGEVKETGVSTLCCPS